MSKTKVLVVDDDDFLVEEIKLILNQEYNVICTETGKDILDLLDSQSPEIIILDVNLPDLDGYQVCSIIKGSNQHSTIPVLFLSGINDLEHRIRGYEVGGEDYVAKPFNGLELKAKIQTLIRHRLTTEQYKQQADCAMQSTMSVITSSGETAYVVDFMRESYQCKSLGSLAEKLVELCSVYGLSILVRFSCENQELFKATTGLMTPLEKSLFDHIPSDVHLHTFNNRCIFNYGTTVLFVKNMPPDDPEKCGRIRDNVAIITEAANAAVESITHADLLRKQKNGLVRLMEHSSHILELIEKETDQQRLKSTEIMSGLITDIEASYMHLGLTEEQETALINAVKKAEKQQLRLFKVGDKVQYQLGDLIMEFGQVIQSDYNS